MTSEVSSSHVPSRSKPSMRHSYRMQVPNQRQDSIRDILCHTENDWSTAPRYRDPPTFSATDRIAIDACRFHVLRNREVIGRATKIGYSWATVTGQARSQNEVPRGNPFFPYNARRAQAAKELGKTPLTPSSSAKQHCRFN
eukprot:GEMP01061698.1.p1 GENE.GEMP01061698.1~~GEMP01061698.1.p1  ORF type:complete len:141 (+),score=18.07 GEMP01061698.1:77-499(+)